MMDEIKKLILGLDCDAAVSASESTIHGFETGLNMKFGPQYTAFLKEFGTLRVCCFEYYGICGDNNSVPSAVHVTLMNRRHIDKFPSDLVVFSEAGNGVLYCVDASDKVFSFDGGIAHEVGMTFVEFLKKQVGQLKK
jgi:hypothetical protein